MTAGVGVVADGVGRDEEEGAAHAGIAMSYGLAFAGESREGGSEPDSGEASFAVSPSMAMRQVARSRHSSLSSSRSSSLSDEEKESSTSSGGSSKELLDSPSESVSELLTSHKPGIESLSESEHWSKSLLSRNA